MRNLIQANRRNIAFTPARACLVWFPHFLANAYAIKTLRKLLGLSPRRGPFITKTFPFPFLFSLNIYQSIDSCEPKPKKFILILRDLILY